MGARVRVIGALFLSCLIWSVTAPASASDEFIAGYATGILQHEFGITDASVEVRDGDVIVTTKSLATIDRGKVVSALEQVPGVSHVEIRSAESAAPPPAEDTVQTTIPTADAKWLPHGNLFAPFMPILGGLNSEAPIDSSPRASISPASSQQTSGKPLQSTGTKPSSTENGNSGFRPASLASST